MIVKPVVVFLVATALVYCAVVNTVPANVRCETCPSAATFAALITDTPVIVKPEVANLPLAWAYSALLKRVTPLAKLSEVTFACVPKVVLSRSVLVTPMTPSAVRWLSPTSDAIFAVETPVMVKPPVVFLEATALLYSVAVNTVPAKVRDETCPSAAIFAKFASVTPVIVKPEVVNFPFALMYSALLKLVTPLAKVSDETLACAPKVVLSRSAAVTPMTVMAFTWLSPTSAPAFAVETPVMVKPVVVFLVATALVYCVPVNTVPASVIFETCSSATTVAAFSTLTPVIVKPVETNLPFAFTYSALLRLVTSLAKVIEVTLDSAPKLAVSRSLGVAPVTLMAVTLPSMTTSEVADAYATGTPLIVKPDPDEANFPFAFTYSA